MILETHCCPPRCGSVLAEAVGTGKRQHEKLVPVHSSPLNLRFVAGQLQGTLPCKDFSHCFFTLPSCTTSILSCGCGHGRAVLPGLEGMGCVAVWHLPLPQQKAEHGRAKAAHLHGLKKKKQNHAQAEGRFTQGRTGQRVSPTFGTTPSAG